jgi:D-glycero-alpha-D-manno-heptose-7-phosphate kinase
LVKTTIANTSERREIAEIAWSIGNLLGILGGRQDEYASALGGINFLTFGQSVVAERLAVDPGFVEKLRSHLVLVYTGESRFSSAIHEAVWERYRNGNASVISALHELTGLAGATRDAIIARNLENFASLISQNWTQQQILDPSVTTTAMQSILDFSTKNGALGGKACGAGGGGCLLLVAAPDQAERLRSALQKRKVEIIDFDFDTYGVFLTKG